MSDYYDIDPGLVVTALAALNGGPIGPMMADRCFADRVGDFRPLGAAVRVATIAGIDDRDPRVDALGQRIEDGLAAPGGMPAPTHGISLQDLAHASTAGQRACAGLMAGAAADDPAVVAGLKAYAAAWDGEAAK